MWCSTSSGSLCMVRRFSPPGVLRLMSCDASASSSSIWACTAAVLSSAQLGRGSAYSRPVHALGTGSTLAAHGLTLYFPS